MLAFGKAPSFMLCYFSFESFRKGSAAFLYHSHCLAKALEVDYLALTKKPYRIVDVGVIGEAEDVVVGHASLLLC